MKFTRDFTADLEQIDFFASEPWALIRFGDGEARMLMGERIDRQADGWTWPVAANDEMCQRQFRNELGSSLIDRLPGLYVGLACPCCDPLGHEYLLERQGHPPERTTFSNLFVNANYERARDKICLSGDVDGFVVVGSTPLCSIEVPPHIPNESDPLACCEQIVHELMTNPKVAEESNTPGVKRCILLCCGPASNVIAHRYWQTAKERQTIVDVGSLLDPVIKPGQRTRGYHDPEHPNRKKVCRWNT